MWLGIGAWTAIWFVRSGRRLQAGGQSRTPVLPGGAYPIFVAMREYFRLSRTLTYSLLFVAPLFILYEIGAAYLNGLESTPLRNGADVLLRTLVASGGVRSTAGFTGVLLAIALVLIIIERRRQRVPLRATIFAGMLLESLAYALVFGAVVGTATQWVLRGTRLGLAAAAGPVSGLSLREGLVLSLGAGIYEELVFRVLLVGGLFGIFRSSGVGRRPAGFFSATLAALVFSGFHYIGPYGDPFTISSFLFRFLAGLAFSALFLVRGFGVTAWTHALYDVVLFLARGL